MLRNPEMESVFKYVPNERFFLETDTIDEGIQAVCTLAAKYKGVSKEEIQEIIRTNFNKVFKIKF